jgi:hypothetical protein
LNLAAWPRQARAATQDFPSLASIAPGHPLHRHRDPLATARYEFAPCTTNASRLNKNNLIKKCRLRRSVVLRVGFGASGKGAGPEGAKSAELRERENEIAQ